MRIYDEELGKFRRARAGEVLHSYNSEYVAESMIPPSVQALLDKAEEEGWAGPMMSDNAWEDIITPKARIARSGAAVSNTTTETIMTPDFLIPADTMESGDIYKWTLIFEHSTVVTTPGTITFRLRFGGVAGTLLATSGAFAPDPTAASTNLSGMIEWWTAVRGAPGTAGATRSYARIVWNDFDDASATSLKGNLDMQMAPVSANADVNIDSTTDKALTPTVAFSVATAGTNLTTHIAYLESLN
jgi:hypothetical protein